jgi:phosphoglycolate phosphatase-like HAD superfamily hydrolase
VKLVLFDIDGTLIHSGGQAKPMFAEAMLEVFGTSGAIDSYDFSGRTDGRIVVELMVGAGIAEAEARARLPEVREHYLARMADRFDAGQVRILPGVRELLDQLEARADVATGLLTGNWHGGARIKLGGVGLFERFPFGGFADDAIDRRDLPPFALARAGDHCGTDFAPEEVVVIGDSLLDVDCARANGLRCLAVASGWTPAAALVAAGADWTVEDLVGVGGHPAFAGAAVRPAAAVRS